MSARSNCQNVPSCVGIVLASGLVIAACGGGDSGGGSGGTSGVDGGGSGGLGGASGGVGGVGGGAGGGTSECVSDGDCAATMPATNPADCAEAKCDLVLKKCNFIAKDADGDGHTASSCTAIGSGAIETGDDCDDADGSVYPGSTSVPCTAGVGECSAAGYDTCVNGLRKCSATPGTPSPDSPLCDGKDHDCDGVTNSGCGCKTGETQPCGPCNDGTANCASGKWGACGGGTQNYGAACGSCGGTVQCGGGCSKPTQSNWNQSCGSCGGKIDCNGACSVSTPANFGDACSAGVGACKQVGTYLCTGACSVSGGTPDQTFHTSPAPNGSFDWNCSADYQYQYSVNQAVGNSIICAGTTGTRRSA